MCEMLDHNGMCHFGSSIGLGSLNPVDLKNALVSSIPTPHFAMASSATTVSSFELLEELQITEADVEMANQEAQEVRTREVAVAAGLVLDEPPPPPSGGCDEGPLRRRQARPRRPGWFVRGRWMINPGTLGSRTSRTHSQPCRHLRPLCCGTSQWRRWPPSSTSSWGRT